MELTLNAFSIAPQSWETTLYYSKKSFENANEYPTGTLDGRIITKSKSIFIGFHKPDVPVSKIQLNIAQLKDEQLSVHYLYYCLYAEIESNSTFTLGTFDQNSLTLYLPDHQYDSQYYKAWNTYTLKITCYENFQLWVHYTGLTFTSKLNLNHILAGVSLEYLDRFFCQNQVYSKEELPRCCRNHRDLIFPVITPEVAKRLKWMLPKENASNPYLLQWRKMKKAYTLCLMHLDKIILTNQENINDSIPAHRIPEKFPIRNAFSFRDMQICFLLKKRKGNIINDYANNLLRVLNHSKPKPNLSLLFHYNRDASKHSAYYTM